MIITMQHLLVMLSTWLQQRSQIFLAEVDQFEARINFSNADYQPISSYLSISVPTSYTVTLTFSEAVIRDDVVLKPIYDALASGASPVFEFCGRFRTSSGRYNRQVFRECIPDGSVDLMSLKPGEIIKRQWSFRVNSTPQLQEFITGE